MQSPGVLLFKSARSELLKWDSVTITPLNLFLTCQMNPFPSIPRVSVGPGSGTKKLSHCLCSPLPLFKRRLEICRSYNKASPDELDRVVWATNVPSQRRSKLKTSTIHDLDILWLFLTFITFIMLSWICWITGEEEVVSVGSSVPCMALLDTVWRVCLLCGVSDF